MQREVFREQAFAVYRGGGAAIRAAATRQLEEVGKEVVADKGHHSNAMMVVLYTRPVRSYVNAPHRGRRSWKKNKESQQPTYANRRRMKGARGKALSRKRSEVVARIFAHLLHTGGGRKSPGAPLVCNVHGNWIRWGTP